MKKSLLIFILIFSWIVGNTQVLKPFGAIPSDDQLKWQRMERYAFIHFNMNTFTGFEWGEGNESPALFKPDSLDCEQWARILKKAGFKAIILTAKHHDGFCLWPSLFTEHSVKNSTWRGGKGDVLKELSYACRKYGLKMGIYYSPWDRNHAEYGKHEYITYMKNQLNELLTEYGDVFEVWFDGANGGKGFYGGANEIREVDRQKYYKWPEMFSYVKSLMPDAIIFSDGGPDARWVGNENGLASETNWCTLNRDEFYPGSPLYPQLGEGHRNGTHWVPAEVDVSIRPGWYYHPEEDDKVKNLDVLMDIYYSSAGRNANMLLNVPVDNHGLISRSDSARLMEFGASLQQEFAVNYAPEAELSANCSYTKGKEYGLTNLTDMDPDSYWVSGVGCAKPIINIEFQKEVTMKCLLLMEGIRYGQRISSFYVEAFLNGQWLEIAKGTTIGNMRLLRFTQLKTTKLRVIFDAPDDRIVVAELGVY